MADYEDPRPTSQDVGSTEGTVLKDNLITLDTVMNAPSGTEITNRKGDVLKPIVDIVSDATNVIQQVADDVASDTVRNTSDISTLQGEVASALDDIESLQLDSITAMQSAAVSLAIGYDEIILSTDLVSAIPAYIFVADGNITYSAPGDAQGKFIDNVVDSVLTTTDVSTYTLLKIKTSNLHIDVELFGAVDGGVIDSTAAIQSAIDYAISIRTSIESNGNENDINIVGEGAYLISDQLIIPKNTNGILNTGVNFLVNSLIVKTWDGVAGNPALELHNPKSKFNFKLFCGNSGCAGVLMNASYDQVWDNVEVYNFSDYGLKISGGTGNNVFQNITLQQWRPEDYGYDTLENRTATSLWIAGAGDNRFNGGNVAWGLVQLVVDSGSYNNLFIGTHFWTGGPDTNPTVDATIIETYTNTGLHLKDCYFDNGYIDIYGDSIDIDGGFFVNDTSVATLTSNKPFRWYADGGAQPSFTVVNNLSGQTTGVQFLPNGDDDWLGDYSVINSTEADVGWSSNVYRTRRDVYTQDNERISHLVQTPGGAYVQHFDIGSSSSFEVRVEGSSYTIKTFDGGVFKITSSDITTHPSRMGFGGLGSVGISETISGALSVQVYSSTEDNNTTSYWTFTGEGVNGNLLPVSDNFTNIGSAGQRVSNIFAANGTINTSDETLKTFEDITDIEKIVATEIKSIIKKFKWNDAIEAEADEARIHFGVGAQSVRDIFKANGLDAGDYSMFCYDEWGEEADSTENVTLQAGSRYGIRYTELIMFILAAI